MTVVMMGQMSLDNAVEKSEKKNDQDQVDGMRQELELSINQSIDDENKLKQKIYHIKVLLVNPSNVSK